MKVLHVIPGIAWRYGGTTATIRSLCGELACLPDIDIELVTTNADGANGQLKPCDIPQGYPVHVFARTATEQWKYSRDLGKWLTRYATRFDVLHIHAIWSYASYAAARAAQRANVPYIIRPAGMLSKYTFTHGAWKKRLYWRLVEHRTIGGAAAFHATSSAERNEIECARPNALVHVIPNGVDNVTWRRESTGFAGCPLLHERCSGRAVVLFLSRLHPKKGIVDLLLPAWAQVNTDAMLVIAGGADAHAPEYAKLVHHEINRLGLASRVQLLGTIPPEARWELYDAADLFVLPSHSENFGVVVAEAMSRGCPVVITDKVQACEHVIAADAGAVVPPNVSAIAKSITSFLGDADRRQKCSVTARSYAKSHFSWRNIAIQVRQMYEQTANASGQPKCSHKTSAI